MHAKTKLFYQILKSSHFKHQVEKRMLKPERTQTFVPKWLMKKHQPFLHEIDGQKLVTFGDPNASLHLFFLHGGGYIFEISTMHWRLLDKLNQSIKAKISVINYPLAPENGVDETYSAVIKMYDYLVGAYPTDKMVLVGDSAGGGLALGLAHHLALNSHAKPASGVVVISPFLDMTLSSPGLSEMADFDHVLTMDLLKHCIKAYSKGANLSDPMLSPLFADYSKFPPCAIFYGTHELFYKDCLRLKADTHHLNHLNFYEYPDMQHDWVLFPIPEQEEAIKDISDFINQVIM